MTLMHTGEPTTILKRDALGRVTVTRAQREALLDEFERCGLKGLPFARMAGVNYQTFASWVQKRRHQRGGYAAQIEQARHALAPRIKSAPLRLLEAVPTATRAAPPHEPPAVCHAPLEVLLPCGARLLIHGTVQVALAAQLLQTLRTPC
jgi:hypothetical protein